jgi:site-specific recombinase XerD
MSRSTRERHRPSPSAGFKFFFEKTLAREFTTFKLVRAQREKKLPVILSVEEVLAILERVRLTRYRVCLSTIYSCGLRLQEGTMLPERFVKIRYYGCWLLATGDCSRKRDGC